MRRRRRWQLWLRRLFGGRRPAARRGAAGAARPTGFTRRELFRGRLPWALPAAAAPSPAARNAETATSGGVEADARPISPAAVAARDAPSLQGILLAPVAPTRLAPRTSLAALPVFRPPGAVAEPEFLAGCTRCGECIAACPYQAIRVAPPRYGPAAGTPVVEADVQACWMCADFPCIASCEPQVLLPQPHPVMGVARITELLCLAYHGTVCTVCSERCPVPGAIALNSSRPTVRDDVCTGCGVCRYVCPAPENAVLLMPLLRQPARSALVAANRPPLPAADETPERRRAP